VLLVGHGSERSSGPARTMAAHAGRLRRLGLFAEVRSALLTGGPAIAETAGGLDPAETYVVPMFMSDGYFTRRALPEKLAAAAGDAASDWHLCAPVGLNPGLPALIAERAREALRKRGVAFETANLLLIGHGSEKNPASWQATETTGLSVRIRREFKTVTTAFLDQRPGIAEVLDELDDPVVSFGLFAADGGHAMQDIPEVLSRTSRDVINLGPIGTDPVMADLAIDEIAALDARTERLRRAG